MVIQDDDAIYHHMLVGGLKYSFPISIQPGRTSRNLLGSSTTNQDCSQELL